MREKFAMVGSIGFLLTVVVIVGFLVYDFGRLIVEGFGPFDALLVVVGAAIVFRIADLAAPRSDGESWFWSVLRSGGE